MTKTATKPTARTTAAKKAAATKPVAAKKAVATRKPVATKTVAAKKPVVRTKAVRKLGAVVATREPVTPQSSKKAPAKKVTARKPAPAKVRVAARQVAAVSVQLAPAPAVKTKRPLIALVRRTDSRPVSYGERLAALMHKKMEHVGPVCHRCLHNASQLAHARSAGPVVAV